MSERKLTYNKLNNIAQLLTIAIYEGRIKDENNHTHYTINNHLCNFKSYFGAVAYFLDRPGQTFLLYSHECSNVLKTFMEII